MTHLEAIRLRPGMYLGRLDHGEGIAHLVWEVVANGIDEYLAGRCSRITVEVQADGSISVEDDGRGIPVEEVDRVSPAERALTSMHQTPTLDGHAPHEHLGPRGLGLFVVCAYSEWLELRVRRGGRQFAQRFSRGVAVSKLRDEGPAEATGTRVAFMPDPQIFPPEWFNSNGVVERLRELGYLMPGLAFHFADHREHRFHEPRGIVAHVEARAGVREAAGPTFQVTAASGQILVEVAARWRSFGCDSMESFANVHPTTDGGTHIDGFLLGLVAGLRKAAPAACAERPARRIQSVLRSGLVATVCVRLDDPRYAGPTKDCLCTPAAKLAVRKCVEKGFRAFLEAQPAMLARFMSELRPAERRK